MGTHPIFESDFDCLTEMKLVQLLLGLVPAESIINFDIKDALYDALAERTVDLEQGGTLEHNDCSRHGKILNF